MIFVEQSEEAIAAGAFHNDVVAVANERVLFAHEQAFADKQALIAECGRLVSGFEYVEVPAAEVPLADANPVLPVQRAAGHSADRENCLIVPTEARDTPTVWNWLQRHVAGNGPIRKVEVVDVRNRWRTAEGRPACGSASSPIRRASIRASWSTMPSSMGWLPSSAITGPIRSITRICRSPH